MRTGQLTGSQILNTCWAWVVQYAPWKRSKSKKKTSLKYYLKPWHTIHEHTPRSTNTGQCGPFSLGPSWGLQMHLNGPISAYTASNSNQYSTFHRPFFENFIYICMWKRPHLSYLSLHLSPLPFVLVFQLNSFWLIRPITTVSAASPQHVLIWPVTAIKGSSTASWPLPVTQVQSLVQLESVIKN